MLFIGLRCWAHILETLRFFSNKIPQFFLHVQKTRLGVGLIAPNAVICMLAMRLHAGKKRLQSDLSKIIEVHQENSFIDSGLRKEGRKVCSNNKHWKEG